MSEETRFFHYHNENPKNKKINDCTYRALALFLGKTWENIARLDAEFYFEHGMWLYGTEITGAVSRSCLKDFMQEYGCRQIYNVDIKGHNKIESLQEFIENMADSVKKYFCELNGHVTVIKDNKVWDTFDSSGYCPVAIYEL